MRAREPFGVNAAGTGRRPAKVRATSAGHRCLYRTRPQTIGLVHNDTGQRRGSIPEGRGGSPGDH